MNIFNALLCLVLLLSAMNTTYSDTPLRVPQARLPLMQTAPTIDGNVNDDEWAGAVRMERFGWGGVLSAQEASFWVGCDGKEIFVAVVSETPPGGKLLARVPPAPEDGDARTWLDDSIEMVFDPLRADTTGRRRLYHANVNFRGALNDTAYKVSGGGEAWRGHWRTASQIVGDRWHFEAALPLADMGVAEADLKNPFGIRIVRNWQQRAVGPEQTEWGAIAGAFLNPDTLPIVTWDARAPVVQVLQLQPPGKQAVHLRVAIRNPHAEPLEIHALLKTVPKNSAPATVDRVLKVGPGEVAHVELVGAGMTGENIYGFIQIASPDDSALYYLRDFHWRLDRPESIWALDADAVKKVDVSFAYFPSHNAIKAVVNVGGLEARNEVRGVKVSVRSKEKSRIIAATQMPALTNSTTQKEWEIPPLNEGEYQFVVELDGVKVAPMTTEFVRHVMPWEGNKLGKSDVVVPPFEPIQVSGRTISTILRKHALNNLGLWDQIESDGRPLLKAPMRLEVNSVEATAKPLRFAQKKPTRAVAESHWSAGAVTGTARGEWDYDGLMKWTLEIAPSKQAINSMTLTIPLDDRLMPLFHACTDGLRFNYAGATPPGQGRVWDGSKAARNSIIGSYVPYIWLGAEERGLAVFGENDRGWVRDPRVPCQELVRHGDTLELRLNLIAAPKKLDQPRRIVIGFQATPTKPMPEGWRTWTVNMGYHPGVECSQQFLGCCWQWGTLTAYSDIYPRDEDFRVYDKLAEARRTGTVDREFMEKWLAGYKVGDESERPSIRSNLDYGFRVCAGKPQNILAYTNARGVRFDTREGVTFLDEWNREAFSTRRWPYGNGVGYDLDPVASFRDYAMWYYRKMLDTFCDGIYWDNTYLQSNFDTVGTDAYPLPDGSIQPSVGLFNMRGLVRRTALLFHETKKRPLNMAHMTNTAIAPILSFLQTHLTWEDRSGDNDFQDRFSRDYLRAESIGRQHGNVPFALLLISGPDEKKNAWAKRTAAGVCLTHEIRPVLYPDEWWKNFTKLIEFGYGKPGVRVSNYWDADHPVRVEGGETATLVVSKPGSAIVVVCDYGNGGDLSLKLNTVALALRGALAATDLENGQTLLITSEGRVGLKLRRHDFRVIQVDAR